MNSSLRQFYDHYGVAAPRDPISKSSFQNPSAHSSLLECTELTTKGISNGTVPGTDHPNNTRVSTAELVDFVKEQALRRPIKEVAKLTGLSTKAVENIRSGEAAASGTTISTWCKNCPEFRTEYFRWVGGYMETDPEFVKGITMALQSLARRKIGE